MLAEVLNGRSLGDRASISFAALPGRSGWFRHHPNGWRVSRGCCRSVGCKPGSLAHRRTV